MADDASSKKRARSAAPGGKRQGQSYAGVQIGNFTGADAESTEFSSLPKEQSTRRPSTAGPGKTSEKEGLPAIKSSAPALNHKAVEAMLENLKVSGPRDHNIRLARPDDYTSRAGKSSKGKEGKKNPYAKPGFTIALKNAERNASKAATPVSEQWSVESLAKDLKPSEDGRDVSDGLASPLSPGHKLSNRSTGRPRSPLTILGSPKSIRQTSQTGISPARQGSASQSEDVSSRGLLERSLARRPSIANLRPGAPTESLIGDGDFDLDIFGLDLSFDPELVSLLGGEDSERYKDVYAIICDLCGDLRSMHACCLQGGFSGAIVIRTEACVSHEGPIPPFVLKVDTQSSIDDECGRGNIMEPHLGEKMARFCGKTEGPGDSLGGARFEFIGAGYFDPTLLESVPLVTLKEMYLNEINVAFSSGEGASGGSGVNLSFSSSLMVIGEVFGTLMCSASCPGEDNAIPAKRNLIQDYQIEKYAKRNVLAESFGEGMAHVEEWLQESGTNLVSMLEEVLEISARPGFAPIPCFLGTVHGDLNGANIIVDWNGIPHLIDFAFTQEGFHNLKDIAKMETCILLEYTHIENIHDKNALSATLNILANTPVASMTLGSFKDVVSLLISKIGSEVSGYRSFDDLAQSMSERGMFSIEKAWETISHLRRCLPRYLPGVRSPLGLNIALMAFYLKAIQFREFKPPSPEDIEDPSELEKEAEARLLRLDVVMHAATVFTRAVLRELTHVKEGIPSSLSFKEYESMSTPESEEFSDGDHTYVTQLNTLQKETIAAEGAMVNMASGGLISTIRGNLLMNLGVDTVEGILSPDWYLKAPTTDHTPNADEINWPVMKRKAEYTELLPELFNPKFAGDFPNCLLLSEAGAGTTTYMKRLAVLVASMDLRAREKVGKDMRESGQNSVFVMHVIGQMSSRSIIPLYVSVEKLMATYILGEDVLESYMKAQYGEGLRYRFLATAQKSQRLLFLIDGIHLVPRDLWSYFLTSIMAGPWASKVVMSCVRGAFSENEFRLVTMETKTLHWRHASLLPLTDGQKRILMVDPENEMREKVLKGMVNIYHDLCATPFMLSLVLSYTPSDVSKRSVSLCTILDRACAFLRRIPEGVPRTSAGGAARDQEIVEFTAYSFHMLAPKGQSKHTEAQVVGYFEKSGLSITGMDEAVFASPLFTRIVRPDENKGTELMVFFSNFIMQEYLAAKYILKRLQAVAPGLTRQAQVIDEIRNLFKGNDLLDPWCRQVLMFVMEEANSSFVYCSLCEYFIGVIQTEPNALSIFTGALNRADLYSEAKQEVNDEIRVKLRNMYDLKNLGALVHLERKVREQVFEEATSLGFTQEELLKTILENSLHLNEDSDLPIVVDSTPMSVLLGVLYGIGLVGKAENGPALDRAKDVLFYILDDSDDTPPQLVSSAVAAVTSLGCGGEKRFLQWSMHNAFVKSSNPVRQHKTSVASKAFEDWSKLSEQVLEGAQSVYQPVINDTINHLFAFDTASNSVRILNHLIKMSPEATLDTFMAVGSEGLSSNGTVFGSKGRPKRLIYCLELFCKSQLDEDSSAKAAEAVVLVLAWLQNDRELNAGISIVVEAACASASNEFVVAFVLKSLHGDIGGDFGGQGFAREILLKSLSPDHIWDFSAALCSTVAPTAITSALSTVKEIMGVCAESLEIVEGLLLMMFLWKNKMGEGVFDSIQAKVFTEMGSPVECLVNRCPLEKGSSLSAVLAVLHTLDTNAVRVLMGGGSDLDTLNGSTPGEMLVGTGEGEEVAEEIGEDSGDVTGKVEEGSDADGDPEDKPEVEAPEPSPLMEVVHRFPEYAVLELLEMAHRSKLHAAVALYRLVEEAEMFVMYKDLVNGEGRELEGLDQDNNGSDCEEGGECFGDKDGVGEDGEGSPRPVLPSVPIPDDDPGQGGNHSVGIVEEEETVEMMVERMVWAMVADVVGDVENDEREGDSAIEENIDVAPGAIRGGLSENVSFDLPHEGDSQGLGDDNPLKVKDPMKVSALNTSFTINTVVSMDGDDDSTESLPVKTLGLLYFIGRENVSSSVYQHLPCKNILLKRIAIMENLRKTDPALAGEYRQILKVILSEGTQEAFDVLSMMFGLPAFAGEAKSMIQLHLASPFWNNTAYGTILHVSSIGVWDMGLEDIITGMMGENDPSRLPDTLNKFTKDAEALLEDCDLFDPVEDPQKPADFLASFTTTVSRAVMECGEPGMPSADVSVLAEITTKILPIVAGLDFKDMARRGYFILPVVAEFESSIQHRHTHQFEDENVICPHLDAWQVEEGQATPVFSLSCALERFCCAEVASAEEKEVQRNAIDMIKGTFSGSLLVVGLLKRESPKAWQWMHDHGGEFSKGSGTFDSIIRGSLLKDPRLCACPGDAFYKFCFMMPSKRIKAKHQSPKDVAAMMYGCQLLNEMLHSGRADAVVLLALLEPVVVPIAWVINAWLKKQPAGSSVLPCYQQDAGASPDAFDELVHVASNLLMKAVASVDSNASLALSSLKIICLKVKDERALGFLFNMMMSILVSVPPPEVPGGWLSEPYLTEAMSRQLRPWNAQRRMIQNVLVMMVKVLVKWLSLCFHNNGKGGTGTILNVLNRYVDCYGSFEDKSVPPFAAKGTIETIVNISVTALDWMGDADSEVCERAKKLFTIASLPNITIDHLAEWIKGSLEHSSPAVQEKALSTLLSQEYLHQIMFNHGWTRKYMCDYWAARISIDTVKDIPHRLMPAVRVDDDGGNLGVEAYEVSSDGGEGYVAILDHIRSALESNDLRIALSEVLCHRTVSYSTSKGTHAGFAGLHAVFTGLLASETDERMSEVFSNTIPMFYKDWTLFAMKRKESDAAIVSTFANTLLDNDVTLLVACVLEALVTKKQELLMKGRDMLMKEDPSKSSGRSIMLVILRHLMSIIVSYPNLVVIDGNYILGVDDIARLSYGGGAGVLELLWQYSRVHPDSDDMQAVISEEVMKLVSTVTVPVGPKDVSRRILSLQSLFGLDEIFRHVFASSFFMGKPVPKEAAATISLLMQDAEEASEFKESWLNNHVEAEFRRMSRMATIGSILPSSLSDRSLPIPRGSIMKARRKSSIRSPESWADGLFRSGPPQTDRLSVQLIGRLNGLLLRFMETNLQDTALCHEIEGLVRRVDKMDCTADAKLMTCTVTGCVHSPPNLAMPASSMCCFSMEMVSRMCEILYSEVISYGHDANGIVSHKPGRESKMQGMIFKFLEEHILRIHSGSEEWMAFLNQMLSAPCLSYRRGLTASATIMLERLPTILAWHAGMVGSADAEKTPCRTYIQKQALRAVCYVLQMCGSNVIKEQDVAGQVEGALAAILTEGGIMPPCVAIIIASWMAMVAQGSVVVSSQGTFHTNLVRLFGSLSSVFSDCLFDVFFDIIRDLTRALRHIKSLSDGFHIQYNRHRKGIFDANVPMEIAVMDLVSHSEPSNDLLVMDYSIVFFSMMRQTKAQLMHNESAPRRWATRQTIITGTSTEYNEFLDHLKSSAFKCTTVLCPEGGADGTSLLDWVDVGQECNERGLVEFLSSASAELKGDEAGLSTLHSLASRLFDHMLECSERSGKSDISTFISAVRLMHVMNIGVGAPLLEPRHRNRLLHSMMALHKMSKDGHDGVLDVIRVAEEVVALCVELAKDWPVNSTERPPFADVIPLFLTQLYDNLVRMNTNQSDDFVRLMVIVHTLCKSCIRSESCRVYLTNMHRIDLETEKAMGKFVLCLLSFYLELDEASPHITMSREVLVGIAGYFPASMELVSQKLMSISRQKYYRSHALVFERCWWVLCHWTDIDRSVCIVQGLLKYLESKRGKRITLRPFKEVSVRVISEWMEQCRQRMIFSSENPHSVTERETDLYTRLVEKLTAARTDLEAVFLAKAMREAARIAKSSVRRKSRSFLERGSSDALKYMNDAYPLHVAASKNASAEIIIRIVEHGGELNAVDELGLTPLHYAVLNAESDDASAVQALLSFPATTMFLPRTWKLKPPRVDRRAFEWLTPTVRRDTPVHWAFRYGRAAAVEEILTSLTSDSNMGAEEFASLGVQCLYATLERMEQELRSARSVFTWQDVSLTFVQSVTAAIPVMLRYEAHRKIVEKGAPMMAAKKERSRNSSKINQEWAGVGEKLTESQVVLRLGVGVFGKLDEVFAKARPAEVTDPMIAERVFLLMGLTVSSVLKGWRRDCTVERAGAPPMIAPIISYLGQFFSLPFVIKLFVAPDDTIVLGRQPPSGPAHEPICRQTALHAFGALRMPESVTYVLDECSKVLWHVSRETYGDVLDSRGETLLHSACRHGNLDVAERLLRRKRAIRHQRSAQGCLPVELLRLHPSIASSTSPGILESFLSRILEDASTHEIAVAMKAVLFLRRAPVFDMVCDRALGQNLPLDNFMLVPALRIAALLRDNALCLAIAKRINSHAPSPPGEAFILLRSNLWGTIPEGVVDVIISLIASDSTSDMLQPAFWKRVNDSAVQILVENDTLARTGMAYKVAAASFLERAMRKLEVMEHDMRALCDRTPHIIKGAGNGISQQILRVHSAILARPRPFAQFNLSTCLSKPLHLPEGLPENIQGIVVGVAVGAASTIVEDMHPDDPDGARESIVCGPTLELFDLDGYGCLGNVLNTGTNTGLHKVAESHMTEFTPRDVVSQITPLMSSLCGESAEDAQALVDTIGKGSLGKGNLNSGGLALLVAIMRGVKWRQVVNLLAEQVTPEQLQMMLSAPISLVLDDATGFVYADITERMANVEAVLATVCVGTEALAVEETAAPYVIRMCVAMNLTNLTMRLLNLAAHSPSMFFTLAGAAMNQADQIRDSQLSMAITVRVVTELNHAKAFLAQCIHDDKDACMPMKVTEVLMALEDDGTLPGKAEGAAEQEDMYRMTPEHEARVAIRRQTTAQSVLHFHSWLHAGAELGSKPVLVRTAGIRGPGTMFHSPNEAFCSRCSVVCSGSGETLMGSGCAHKARLVPPSANRGSATVLYLLSIGPTGIEDMRHLADTWMAERSPIAANSQPVVMEFLGLWRDAASGELRKGALRQWCGHKAQDGKPQGLRVMSLAADVNRAILEIRRQWNGWRDCRSDLFSPGLQSEIIWSLANELAAGSLTGSYNGMGVRVRIPFVGLGALKREGRLGGDMMKKYLRVMAANLVHYARKVDDAGATPAENEATLDLVFGTDILGRGVLSTLASMDSGEDAVRELLGVGAKVVGNRRENKNDPAILWALHSAMNAAYVAGRLNIIEILVTVGGCNVNWSPACHLWGLNCGLFDQPSYRKEEMTCVEVADLLVANTPPVSSSNFFSACSLPRLEKPFEAMISSDINLRVEVTLPGVDFVPGSQTVTRENLTPLFVAMCCMKRDACASLMQHVRVGNTASSAGSSVAVANELGVVRSMWKMVTHGTEELLSMRLASVVALFLVHGVVSAETKASIRGEICKLSGITEEEFKQAASEVERNDGINPVSEALRNTLTAFFGPSVHEAPRCPEPAESIVLLMQAALSHGGEMVAYLLAKLPFVKSKLLASSSAMGGDVQVLSERCLVLASRHGASLHMVEALCGKALRKFRADPQEKKRTWLHHMCMNPKNSSLLHEFVKQYSHVEWADEFKVKDATGLTPHMLAAMHWDHDDTDTIPELIAGLPQTHDLTMPPRAGEAPWVAAVLRTLDHGCFTVAKKIIEARAASASPTELQECLYAACSLGAADAAAAAVRHLGTAEEAVLGSKGTPSDTELGLSGPVITAASMGRYAAIEGIAEAVAQVFHAANRSALGEAVITECVAVIKEGASINGGKALTAIAGAFHVSEASIPPEYLTPGHGASPDKAAPALDPYIGAINSEDEDWGEVEEVDITQELETCGVCGRQFRYRVFARHSRRCKARPLDKKAQ